MRTNEENDARYARLAVTNTFSGTQNIQGDVNLLRLRNQNANNAQYIEGVDLDGSARWLVGISKMVLMQCSCTITNMTQL